MSARARHVVWFALVAACGGDPGAGPEGAAPRSARVQLEELELFLLDRADGTRTAAQLAQEVAEVESRRAAISGEPLQPAEPRVQAALHDLARQALLVA